MPTSITSEAQVESLSVRRRAASRELMRVEILAAAQHIIRTQGLDALSLRALAKSIGITAPALYEYFGNKNAILRAVFVQGSEIMLALMDQTIAESPPGLQRLLAILNGYRTFARDEPDYFRLLFGTVDPNLALSDEDYQGMNTIFERFVGVIADCIETCELQQLPLMTVSCALWALTHGAALLETESFMARKDIDQGGKAPQFDAAIQLSLMSFATEKGAKLLSPLEER